MRFIDIVVVALAIGIMLGGARAVVRRDLAMTGDVFGRRRAARYQGWRAIVGGLIWIAVGALALWQHFRG